jgi:hypothetical protein
MSKKNKEANELLLQRLRYMNAENIMADFPSKEQQDAIKAVFKWLLLNGICAWKTKRGQYTVDALTRLDKMRSPFDPHDAIVIDNDVLIKAEKVFGIK